MYLFDALWLCRLFFAGLFFLISNLHLWLLLWLLLNCRKLCSKSLCRLPERSTSSQRAWSPFISSTLGSVGSRQLCLCDRPTVLHDYSEWSLTGRLHDSKAPRSSHLQKLLRANMCTFVPESRREGVKTRESRVVRSLFCKFKTLVSFPEAAAFAWLDQADLGLSRRPRPSPLDGSSASHATCCTRGAVPRRTAKVAGEEKVHTVPEGRGCARIKTSTLKILQ